MRVSSEHVVVVVYSVLAKGLATTLEKHVLESVLSLHQKAMSGKTDEVWTSMATSLTVFQEELKEKE